MTEEELWLYTLCKKNGIIITDIQIRQLSQYKSALLDWNKKINLISRKNEAKIWKNHITLSISMLFMIEIRSQSIILDLGTGGGFPGIPLSIMLPQCSFVLLDSTQKKITAVQSMAESLDLQNVKTIWGRAEELQKAAHLHHAFDVVVARSVSNLSNLLEWGFPFLKQGVGKYTQTKKFSILSPSLIAFKGAEIEIEEKDAQRKFSAIQLQSIPLTFSGSEEFDDLDKKIIIATRRV